ncbi:MAG: DNA gyrase inhibitor YacG [Rhodomicrobium sp.]|nr:DNA gyrase inhibitor YacG [Rhodomicrobium sp.]
MTNGKTGSPDQPAAPPLCVVCHLRPQTEKYRPFCSKRCADVDLHRWLGGVYAIPGLSGEEEEETPPGQPPAEDTRD